MNLKKSFCLFGKVNFLGTLQVKKMEAIIECPLCDRHASFTFDSLVDHLFRNHPLMEAHRLICQVKGCGQAFHSLFELGQHYLIHTKCNDCGYRDCVCFADEDPGKFQCKQNFYL